MENNAMNQAEWNACTNLWQMLDFLRGEHSDRKMRLFLCACCRRIWRTLPEPEPAYRVAVETAERCADGRQLRAARRRAVRAYWANFADAHRANGRAWACIAA